MGRKKISIKKIADPRNRVVTFNKRKAGLIKKTMELSLLCDAKIALIINCEGKIMQYCSEEIDKFLLDFSEAGEADESYTNTDYSKMFENGGTGPAPTQLNVSSSSSSSKRSSSTKTPDDVLRKLKEDIAMKARIEKQQQAILMLQQQQQQHRVLQMQAQGGVMGMNPMSMSMPAGYGVTHPHQMPNILSMPMNGAGGGLGLRNNPRMYQISSSAEVVKNMDRKEISNIAEQLVRNSSDNPFAELPQINVTIADDANNNKGGGPNNTGKGQTSELTPPGNALSLGLGLPGMEGEKAIAEDDANGNRNANGSNNDSNINNNNKNGTGKRKGDMNPPSPLNHSKRLKK